MAISAQQIQAVLAANPNATQAQIEKAMANYGVTPREFLMATGVDPARYSGNAPAAGGVYTPAYNAPAPAPPASNPVALPSVSPPQAQPQSALAGAGLQGMPQYTEEQIRETISSNPNATPADIQRAMANNNVTPEQMRQALGSRQTGAIGSYADNTINDTLTERFLESGPLSAQDVNRAGIQYGIGREQMANIDPRLMEQTAGLAPARQTLTQTGQDITGITRDAQKKYANQLRGLGGQVGDIYGGAQGYQEQYRDIGGQAAQKQAALTGALGVEAQRQAFADYQASPALDFLQEQSERALLRNAAATGGLGGGNVRQDLTKLTADLYGQDFQNQFNRLGDIATRGYGAAGTSAQLGGQQGQLFGQVGARGVGEIARMSGNLGRTLGTLGQTGAGYQMQTGRDISDAQSQTAVNMGNLQTDLGNTQAANLVNLQNQQIGAYNLGNQYGTNAMNQGLALQGGLANIGNAYAGIDGQTFTPVPAYTLDSALTAGGNAYDLAKGMLSNNNPSYASQLLTGNVPFGTGGISTGINPAQPTYMMAPNPNQNLNLGNGVTTQSLLATF